MITLEIQKYLSIKQINEKIIEIIGAKGNIKKIEDFINDVSIFSKKFVTSRSNFGQIS